jgi:3-dehydroquinate dehydratase-2
MAARVLVLHGPNLNLSTELEQLDVELTRRAMELGFELKIVQANSEGALVDALHLEREKISGVVVNAARLAPIAEVLAEAIMLVKKPSVEVLFDPAMKVRSALRGVVLDQFTGRGVEPYVRALNELKSEADLPAAPPSPPASIRKTIGRKMPTEAERAAKVSSAAVGGLSRAMVRDKIAERLSGKLTPSGLAIWARAQWQQLQRGAPVESGQRDRLEDVLQTLLLSMSSKANDNQLIELMTQLG